MLILRKCTASVTLVGAMTLALLASAAPAMAARAADLTVRQSSVTVSGSSVTGQFVVRNIGGRKARASRVVLLDDLGTPVASWRVRALRAKRAQFMSVNVTVPAGTRTSRMQVCADGTRRVKERNEYNNCVRVGIAPAGPRTFQTNVPFATGGMTTSYWLKIPDAYDRSGRTKIPAFVWLHGCESSAEKDIQNWISPPGRGYVSVAVGGREDRCFDYGHDREWVMGVVDHLVQNYNVDPKRIVLGGFSTGCVLAYRVGMLNSDRIAGIIGENCDPAKHDWVQVLAWSGPRKLPLVQVAHTGDTEAPQDKVTGTMNAFRDVFGYPVTLSMLPGGYYDATTQSDFWTHGLSHMADANMRLP